MPKKRNILDYQVENYVRDSKKVYLDTFKKSAETFAAIAQTLANDEVDGLSKIIDFLDEPSLTDLFPKDQNLTANTNIKELCMENRKKCMEAVAEQFTKVVLKENMAYPKMRLDEIFNVVENYYDSFYVRHSKDKNLDLFLPSRKADLNQIKIKSFKAIQGNVGVEAIEKDFATKKKMSFAKYCIEKSKKHVTSLNNEIRDVCAEIDVEVPEKFTNLELVSRVKVSQVTNTVPTYLHMLNKSYQSRSAAERFFSYFPFINKEAKEERNAISRIEGMLKDVSYLKFTNEQVKSSTARCGYDNKLNYYKEGLKHAGYKPEVVKEQIVVNEIINDELIIDSANKVNDKQIEKEAVKNNDLLV